MMILYQIVIKVSPFWLTEQGLTSQRCNRAMALVSDNTMSCG